MPTLETQEVFDELEMIALRRVMDKDGVRERCSRFGLAATICSRSSACVALVAERCMKRPPDR